MLQKDGYISTSDIEDEEDQDADEGDGKVLGDEATAAYRSIIVQRVLSSQVQQPEKLQRHTCSRFSSSSATVEHVSLLMEVAAIIW